MGPLRSLWEPLIVVASMASAMLPALFVTRWTPPGLVIDAVLVWATLARGWQPTPFFGRTRHTSSRMRETAR